MKQYLTAQEQKELDRRVSETEQRTGSQIVLAVAGRSDAYPDIPWKAFALAASVAGIAAVLVDLKRTSWHGPEAAVMVAAATLLAGAGAALLTVVLPRFARLFLDRQRAEVETRQYAESLFLARQLFATRERTGILLFASLFEHTVVVLPDAGLAERLDRSELEGIIGLMTPLLASKRIGEAFDRGLTGLEEALGRCASPGTSVNELPDTVVQEDGA